MSSTPRRPPPADQSASFELPSRTGMPFGGPDTAPRPKTPPRPGPTPVYPDIPAEEVLNWDDLVRRLPTERSTE